MELPQYAEEFAEAVPAHRSAFGTPDQIQVFYDVVMKTSKTISKNVPLEMRLKLA